MIRRRKLLVAIGAGALAAPLAAFAQKPPKVVRIGFLGSVSAAGYATRVEGLRAGLRELGYVEGKNLVIEFRWADEAYDRLPGLAAELVQSNVDLIVAQSTTGALAARKATTSIPIVMVATADPIAAGLVTNLARPGGNITGLTFFGLELATKRLDLLKQALPDTTQIAHLLNPANPGMAARDAAMKSAAGPMKLALAQFPVRRREELEDAFAAVAKKRIGAMLCNEDPVLNVHRQEIAQLALKHRLVLVGNTDLAEAGGLLGYGVNFPDQFRRAAGIVDKILKGAKPGDLPVERETKFELVINMKTVKALGVKLPQSVLLRADRVIE